MPARTSPHRQLKIICSCKNLCAHLHLSLILLLQAFYHSVKPCRLNGLELQLKVKTFHSYNGDTFLQSLPQYVMFLISLTFALSHMTYQLPIQSHIPDVSQIQFQMLHHYWYDSLYFFIFFQHFSIHSSISIYNLTLRFLFFH